MADSLLIGRSVAFVDISNLRRVVDENESYMAGDVMFRLKSLADSTLGGPVATLSFSVPLEPDMTLQDAEKLFLAHSRDFLEVLCGPTTDQLHGIYLRTLKENPLMIELGPVDAS
ncbi:MAG: hypothetical protein EP335_00125 [Alphaproteobacteria bacterium]|nr:MAG: hypothetical protein EP335_00125 [Alphaproteobacteria bacterium]